MLILINEIEQRAKKECRLHLYSVCVLDLKYILSHTHTHTHTLTTLCDK